MNVDAPIRNFEQDRFGYKNFARQLAPSLLAESKENSLVVGVESAWGSGKTSFLNLTKCALTELDKHALVLVYRPWLYSSSETLILGFCQQLRGDLQDHDPKIYGELSQALDGLAYAIETGSGFLPLPPVVGRLAAKVTKWGSGRFFNKQQRESMTLTNAQAKVQHAIDKAKRPIIVLIDDVDRLPPNDIRLLFQFLKAVVDFRGVVYLLAYDPTPIEKALSFAETLDGKEYLKKFIQLPIRLPRISRILLRRFLHEIINNLGAEIKPRLDDKELAALKAACDHPIFDECFTTPRDVIRAFNLFRMRLSDCRGEITLDNLLLFVILDLICPEAVELVRNNPLAFLTLAGPHPEFESRRSHSLAISLLDDERDIDAQRKKLYEKLPEQNRDVAIGLLTHLFQTSDDRLISDVRQARNPQGLIKLLYGGSSPLGFSAKEAQSFLENRDREELLADKVTTGAVIEWIIFLAGMLGSSTELKNPDALALLLINETLDSKGQYQGRNLHEVIGNFLWDLTEYVMPTSDRLRYVQAIVGQTANLYASENLLRNLTRNAGMWGDDLAFFGPSGAKAPAGELLLPPDDVFKFVLQWIELVRQKAATGTLHEQPELGYILNRWGQFLNDYSEVQSYIASFCEKYDPLIILRHFSLKNPKLDGLGKLIRDPEAVVARLGEYDGDSKLRADMIRVIGHFPRRAKKRD